MTLALEQLVVCTGFEPVLTSRPEGPLPVLTYRSKYPLDEQTDKWRTSLNTHSKLCNHLYFICSLYGIRTRVTSFEGRRPDPPR